MKVLIECIGIFASIILIVALLFKTTTVKGSIYMRSINIVGSAIYVGYAILISSISMIILNIAIIGVNIYHLVMLGKELKKNKEINNTAKIVENQN